MIHYPNKDDYDLKFWSINYRILLTMQGIEFHVNADCFGDAMDFIMDYIVENKMNGLFTDKEPEYSGDYIQAGNNGYWFTTYNIYVERQ